jgi:hypothetical protein
VRPSPLLGELGGTTAGPGEASEAGRGRESAHEQCAAHCRSFRSSHAVSADPFRSIAICEGQFFFSPMLTR